MTGSRSSYPADDLNFNTLGQPAVGPAAYLGSIVPSSGRVSIFAETSLTTLQLVELFGVAGKPSNKKPMRGRY